MTLITLTTSHPVTTARPANTRHKRHALASRPATLLARLLALSLSAACLLPVAAAPTPQEYSALLKAGKLEELDRATQAALAATPNQTDALVARVSLMLSLGQEDKVEEAVKLAEQCVQAHPQQAQCHEQLGNALGTKAVRAGIFSAMGYVGKIRDAFKKAVELEPNGLNARFSLLQFYQQAPSFVGGGKGNAQELVQQTHKVNPYAARLMQGSLDLAEKEYAKVEASVATPLPEQTDALHDRQRSLMSSLGAIYVQEKRFADAQRMFGEVQKRFPQSEAGAYGVGRTLQEQGKHAEALANFEKALAIKSTAAVHYRIAQALQSLADKTRAIAAYEKALTFTAGLSKKQREDVQEQIKVLKG